jgi:hypothetical protein
MKFQSGLQTTAFRFGECPLWVKSRCLCATVSMSGPKGEADVIGVKADLGTGHYDAAHGKLLHRVKTAAPAAAMWRAG